MTLDQLPKSQPSVIKTMHIEHVPLKLIEIGCMPGNIVEVLQVAPFSDPIYIKVNDSFMNIRRDLAQQIEVELI